MGTKDPELVVWAAQHNRIIVSRDKNTLIQTHTEYIHRGHRTPGLFIVNTHNVSELVEFLALVAHCADPHEFESSTQFIPLS